MQKVYHAIDWISAKRKRVIYSSYGADILACIEAKDRGFYIITAMRCILRNKKVKHEINVDSKGLYDTISILHGGLQYRLKQ